jgi:putative transposase
MAKPEKYQGKYRVPSARWADWDYGSNAAYFVTICTAGRVHDFGTITDGRMIYTALGRTAVECWNEIPAHFPFVELGEFVVMPNHVHGIVIINKPGEGGGYRGGYRRDAKFCVSTKTTTTPPTATPTPPTTTTIPTPPTPTSTSTPTPTPPPTPPTPHPPQPHQPQNQFGPQSKNLASIIRGYKIGVTKFARQNDIPFAWQPRYHDHVIRNLEEFDRINQYIRNNVQNWVKDAFYNQLSDQGVP